MNTEEDMGLTAYVFTTGKWAVSLSFWWIMRYSIPFNSFGADI
jgi:hypothetical protein